ncbi:MAG: sodium-translocating pyrophosphatase [Candidatus Saccharibacteria bacterium]|nr:sodium-translocating pyrophosphatase [Candidatus Saccharibacteria bacterium]
MLTYLVVLAIALLALVVAIINYRSVRRGKSGTKEMEELSKTIRGGANIFMITEFKTIGITVGIVAVLFTLFIEVTSGLTFVLGAMMSSAACVFGMKAATFANVKTTNTARETKSISKTVRTALRGGSVSGLSVQAFGLFGLVILLLVTGGVKLDATSTGVLLNLKCNPYIMRLTTYSLGCSLVAMFNRVAGGNYTKAADISADILGKIRNDLPEDDSRVPNTIADFIGDLVNDIAGNCSDLLESFVATVVAAILIAASTFQSLGEAATEKLFTSMVEFPVLIAGIGLISCVIGIAVVLKITGSSGNPSKTLDLATYISAGAVSIGSVVCSAVMFLETPNPNFKLGWISPAVCIVLGLLSGVAIGKITEYYTSFSFRPVKDLAKMSLEGEAFVVTKGDAIGSKSCLAPILVIVVSLLIAGGVSGIYGIAIAALGMLSFVATTVSVDAFGPIADNAGGIAEACHLDSDVRKITDQLDAVGNTTAAIGKGFAIGSAAFATVSLIFAYVGSYSMAAVPVLNIASFVVIGGALVGGALIEFFSAKLTDNTIESARKMAVEGDRQMTKEVIEGKAKPDYNRLVEMATQEALHRMLFPSLLALLVPVFCGILFGVEFVGGMLIGATVVAVPRAIFMGNSGGAFDNAKKFVEGGFLKGHGKGSAAHKATVTGDTIGDTRKDVVGVALDIFIKMMSTVANTLAPIFSSFRLF